MFHLQRCKTVFAFLVLLIVADHHADLNVSGQGMVPPLLVGSQFVVMMMVVFRLMMEIDGNQEWVRELIRRMVVAQSDVECFPSSVIRCQVELVFHEV